MGSSEKWVKNGHLVGGFNQAIWNIYAQVKLDHENPRNRDRNSPTIFEENHHLASVATPPEN